MATKTIRVDLEAFRLLERVRHGDESISDTIRRIARPAPSLASWLERVSEVRFSDEFLSGVEEQIKSRSVVSRRRKTRATRSTRRSRPARPSKK